MMTAHRDLRIVHVPFTPDEKATALRVGEAVKKALQQQSGIKAGPLVVSALPDKGGRFADCYLCFPKYPYHRDILNLLNGEGGLLLNGTRYQVSESSLECLRPLEQQFETECMTTSPSSRVRSPTRLPTAAACVSTRANSPPPPGRRVRFQSPTRTINSNEQMSRENEILLEELILVKRELEQTKIKLQTLNDFVSNMREACDSVIQRGFPE